jgi:predicted protein tyrosine phosphatase
MSLLEAEAMTGDYPNAVMISIISPGYEVALQATFRAVLDLRFDDMDSLDSDYAKGIIEAGLTPALFSKEMAEAIITLVEQHPDVTHIFIH